MAKKKAFSVRYVELKKAAYGDILKKVGNKDITAQGKKYYLFPYLDDIGFDTWEKIYNEVVLIVDKKSNQSREVRNLLVTAYHLSTKTV